MSLVASCASMQVGFSGRGVHAFGHRAQPCANKSAAVHAWLHLWVCLWGIGAEGVAPEEPPPFQGEQAMLLQWAPRPCLIDFKEALSLALIFP